MPMRTAQYLRSKVPIVEWIPSYSPSWLVNDILAGITIGVLLVPQSLSYATVANIPSRYGLISSWLPCLFYAIMGTSKDVTAGPTAIMGLLTGEIVSDFAAEGYSAIAVASCIAFWVGIYSLILGLFRLGFLLDFIPLPVLSGYVSGAAITIILQQLKALFGEPDTGSSTTGYIRFFFKELPQTNWRAFLIGFSGIALLVGMQEIGRRLGKRHKAFWYLGITRNALALVMFTLISWGVNKDLKSPLFGIAKTTGTGIVAPSTLNLDLLVKVAGRSIAVFLAAALEHLAIGKAFSRRHGYEIDQDQELTYIGVVNLFTSFFSCMPITGGFSRTAVNAESGVKSPLGGLVTSACVLVSIYKLTPAFYWIPSATLSAIIVVAVWQIVLPPRIFWHYWKTSFADFIGSMIGFWITLFVSVEIGIAAAVGYSLLYLLFQVAFTRVTLVNNDNVGDFYRQQTEAINLPDDALVFILQDAVLFPNATRVSRQICEHIYTHSAQVVSEEQAALQKSSQRLWNDTRTKLVSSLRRRAGISTEVALPRLSKVVLDMTRVAHIDTTGMQALADVRASLQDWAGPEAELQFVGLNEELRGRFSRAEDIYHLKSRKSKNEPEDGGYVVFDVLQTALSARSLGNKSEEALTADVTV
ncbi:sulfate transporter 4.1 [Xylariales sp. PMI_506]|nr:sulfate transporter 4.1 [Xylariales sp. PMI_506]